MERRPASRNTVVIAPAEVYAIGGDAKGAVEGGQAEGRPRLLEPGARPRMRGLMQRGPVTAKPSSVGVTGTVAMELPGMGRPAGAVPMRMAAIAGSVVEGGPRGPSVLVAAVAIRRVIR